MNDAARSAKQNIQEGYRSGSLAKYINHVNISIASLEEARGDVEDAYEDGLISKEEFFTLNELGGKTDYLLVRLLESLYKKQKKGDWKNYHKPE